MGIGVRLLLHFCSKTPQGKICGIVMHSTLWRRTGRQNRPWSGGIPAEGCGSEGTHCLLTSGWKCATCVLLICFYKNNFTAFAFASLSTCNLSEIYNWEILHVYCHLRLHLNELLLQGEGDGSFLCSNVVLWWGIWKCGCTKFVQFVLGTLAAEKCL